MPWLPLCHTLFHLHLHSTFPNLPSASSTYSPAKLQHSASTDQPFPLFRQRLQRHRPRPPLSHPTTDPATPPCVPHLSNDLLLMLYQLTLQTGPSLSPLLLLLPSVSLLPRPRVSPIPLRVFSPRLLSLLRPPFLPSLHPRSTAVCKPRRTACARRSLASRACARRGAREGGGVLFRRRNWCSDFSGVRFFCLPPPPPGQVFGGGRGRRGVL